MLQAFGKPETTKVTMRSGEDHTEPTAPQYLIYPINWANVDSSALGSAFITDSICVTDFGESFEVSDPQQDLGIPQVSVLHLIVSTWENR